MQLLKTLREDFERFLKTFTDLRTAIQANTAATNALVGAAQENLVHARTTKAAVTYLAKAEQHRRQESGQRSDFGGGNV